jgi:DNA-binding transcriptional LysR family regulator
VDLRSLRTFAAVVEHGSFTRAAAALGYTQSAVSQQIGGLEASLGVRLFTRRPFGLTPAAERLAEHAGSILLRVDVATSELAGIDRPATTTIAATPFAAATDEVARLLAAGTHRQQTSGAVLAAVDDPDVAAAQVARRECDAAVVDGIVGPRDPLAHADPGLLTALVVRVAPLAVALPVGHPLAGRRELAWRALADARWIDAPRLLPRPGPGALALRDRPLARTRYDGREPSALGALVAAGHGLALVPAWWRPAATDVHVVPLADPPWTHRIEALVLRPRSADWARLVAAVAAVDPVPEVAAVTVASDGTG